MHIAASCSGVS
jgi:hypothetical protein